MAEDTEIFARQGNSCRFWDALLVARPTQGDGRCPDRLTIVLQIIEDELDAGGAFEDAKRQFALLSGTKRIGKQVREALDAGQEVANTVRKHLGKVAEALLIGESTCRRGVGEHVDGNSLALRSRTVAGQNICHFGFPFRISI